VHIGYPEEVRKFKYDPIFPVRGMLLLSWSGEIETAGRWSQCTFIVLSTPLKAKKTW
jgi:hypothetical protein